MRQGEGTRAGRRRDHRAEKRNSGVEGQGLALPRVEGEPQLAQLSGRIGQGSFGAAAVGDRDGDVVGISDGPVALGEHRAIERVQVEVAQQR